jgi:tetratricopeptide (TPR) repeat protein
MIEVFLSSTFIDLQDEREELTKKILPALNVLHMESFVPDGRKSQVIAIENLRRCDVAVFLISPYYGSLIKPGSCIIPDCKVKDCPRGGISYTHCEYRIAVFENKPRMVFMVEPTRRKPELSQKYADAEILYGALKKEIQHAEMAPEIHEINTDQYDRIISGLVSNIIRWYEEGRVTIKDFYGRGRELRELTERIGRNDRLLVHGVGGIGKTTLIQVALLLQAMLGRKIVAIGTNQSYLSGSGYSYFRSNTAITHQETKQREIISLYDLAEPFKVPEDILKAGKEGLIMYLLSRLKESDRLTFIDDFHLADPDVKELVRQVSSVIMAGKEDLPLGRQRIKLVGVTEGRRLDMVRGIASRLCKPVDDQTIAKIADLSDGHPVVMEILVSNYQDVNYDDIQRALQSEESTGEEFLQRTVKSILTSGALETLQQIAIINPDLETNLDDHALWNTFPEHNIKELTRKGLLAKQENNSQRYHITFQSIQQTIISGHENDGNYHNMALQYYKKKVNQDGKLNLDDAVEVYYHITKCTHNPVIVDRIIQLSKELSPRDYGFLRLVTVCEELIPHLDEKKKAIVFVVSGNLYSNLQQYENAERAFIKGLEIYEKLYAQNPEEYGDCVSGTKNNLGNLYRNTGRHRDAEQVFLEALEIRQKLADQNQTAYNGDMAVTKNSLGNLYSTTGRHGEAEQAYLSALEIYEKLETQNPGDHSSGLAMTQNNLGNLYSNTGRHGEAEQAYLSALEINKELDAKKPGARSSELAATQNNLGILYFKTGRHGDAERAFLAALKIRQQLAAQNPGAYSNDLSATQNNLGNLYRDTDRYRDAELVCLAALEVYEKLAAQNPGAYSGDLAATQSNLGILYFKTGRHGDAERAFLTALKIRQQLAAENPGAYIGDLASTQHNLGILYCKINSYRDAEPALLAALEIRQQLTAQNPEAYSGDLATTQISLGTLHSDTGRYGDAERAFLRTLEIYKKLAAQNPGAYSDDLATAQNSLGILYSKTGRHGDAERAFLAALDIRQRLVSQNPEAYSGELAMTQNCLGNLYMITGQSCDAERAFLDSLTIRQKLAAQNPGVYDSDLAATLDSLGILYNKNGQHVDAERAFLAALDIRQRLASQNPEAYSVELAMTQSNMGNLYSKTGRQGEAERALLAALEIFKKLATKSQEAYNQYVQLVENNLKKISK